jgi:hypothetical protein
MMDVMGFSEKEPGKGALESLAPFRSKKAGGWDTVI